MFRLLVIGQNDLHELLDRERNVEENRQKVKNAEENRTDPANAEEITAKNVKNLDVEAEISKKKSGLFK